MSRGHYSDLIELTGTGFRILCHVVFHSIRKPRVILRGDSVILDMYFLKKIKIFGITKSYGFVYGSASGQVILSFLQQVLVHRVARAAGYLSTLTGNIGSGQNVTWPVVTRGNIGDDAALSRRIDVNITSFDNM